MAKKIKGLFQREGSSTYEYDFVVKGKRHVGNTGLSNRRAAEQMVQEKREKAKRDSAVSTGTVELTFSEAAKRWHDERGQFRKGGKDTLRALAWLRQHVGDNTPISQVNNALLASLVSQRRSENVTHATVNRTVTQLLRAILRRAELWDQPVARIRWGDHILKEPVERVRELSLDEEDQLFDALRPDFQPIMRFLLLTGRRRAEACKLEWQDVDLNGGRMTVRQKGGLVNVIPLSREAVDVLRSQWRRHPTRVFCYRVQHPQGGDIGSLVPISPDRLSTEFKRARKVADLKNFRLHDTRHTTATRMVRATGNLKLAQKALGHANLSTTTKYSHAVEDDVREALEQVSAIKSPGRVPKLRHKMKENQDGYE